MKRDLLPGDGGSLGGQGPQAGVGQLSSLYARWRTPLMRMLRRYFGTPAEVEEATQEVFARLAAAGKAIAPADEQPYLRRAARNVAIDGWRKSPGREGMERVSLESEHGEPDALALQTDADQTDAQAAQHQMLERLDQAVQELPMRQREAFLLHRIEGHTVEETAVRMGISTRMAVKHLSRGLAYCQARVMYASSEQMKQLHAAQSDAADAGDARDAEDSGGGR